MNTRFRTGFLSALLVLLVAAASCAGPTVAPEKAVPEKAAPEKAASEKAASEKAAPAKAAPEKAAPTAAPAAAKPAKPTGEVVIAQADLGMEKWDPSQTRTVMLTHEAGGPLFESLYILTPGGGEPRPFLLESGKMAADGLSWTLKLREGIRFSNGDPMTAEDVKFSLDRYRSKESVSPQAGLFQKSVKDVVVVDRLTTRLELNEPMIPLPSYMSSVTGNEGVIVPKKYVEQVGWQEFNRKPIGSGPYKQVEHKPGESVTYEPVENHWRTTASFAKVRFVKVPEEIARIAMLKSGQADLISITPTTKKEVEQAGFKILAIPYTAFWQLNFYGAIGNYPPGPTSKVEVRKALNLAINRKEIVDNLYGGAGEVPAYTPSAPGFSLGAPKDLKPYPYDPAEAKRLLQQAGYPNGFDMTFYTFPLPACPESRQLAEVVGSQWDKIGVRTQIRPIEYSVFRPLFAGKEHAAQIVGSVANHCAESGAIAIRDLNIYFWGKGTVKLTNVADAEIEKAQAAKSIEELVQYTEAAYRKVYDNYPVVPILLGASAYAASKKLADLPITPGADHLTVWLTQDKP